MLLVDIAKTQIHAAYAAFAHGYVHRFSYLCRTVPNIEHSLEESIRSQLIPTLTGRSSPNDSARELLGLPARLGGQGLVNPTKISSTQYNASISISAPLKDRTLVQNHEYTLDCIDTQVDANSKTPTRQCQGGSNIT